MFERDNDSWWMAFWFVVWLATVGIASGWIMYLYLRVGAGLEALRRWREWEGELWDTAVARKEAREKAAEEGTQTVVQLQQSVEALKTTLENLRQKHESALQQHNRERAAVNAAWRDLTEKIRENRIKGWYDLVTYAQTELDFEDDGVDEGNN